MLGVGEGWGTGKGRARVRSGLGLGLDAAHAVAGEYESRALSDRVAKPLWHGRRNCGFDDRFCGLCLAWIGFNRSNSIFPNLVLSLGIEPFTNSFGLSFCPFSNHCNGQFTIFSCGAQ